MVSITYGPSLQLKTLLNPQLRTSFSFSVLDFPMACGVETLLLPAQALNSLVVSLPAVVPVLENNTIEVKMQEYGRVDTQLWNQKSSSRKVRTTLLPLLRLVLILILSLSLGRMNGYLMTP